ncbi:MAG: DUF4416 family protein [Dissulfurispiraceae bacterium]|jgi:hypothetical protein|nr:DUF4416 family protein [Dissulfurispiraceae bacterium]
MANIRQPNRVLLFAGLLYSVNDMCEKALGMLESYFGEIIAQSPVYDWEHTDYYKDELGENIKRRFIIFRTPVDPSVLSEVKIRTNELEQQLASNGKRTVNIDPGYITPAKIVLASTKDYSHRIYLKDGIYAEVTLIYTKGRLTPHTYTYRDFKKPDIITFFTASRRLLWAMKHEFSAKKSAPL